MVQDCDKRALCVVQADTVAGVLQQSMHPGQTLHLPLRLSRRVPLEGQELLAWQESQTAQVVEDEKIENGHAPPELPTR